MAATCYSVINPRSSLSYPLKVVSNFLRERGSYSSGIFYGDSSRGLSSAFSSLDWGICVRKELGCSGGSIIYIQLIIEAVCAVGAVPSRLGYDYW